MIKQLDGLLARLGLKKEEGARSCAVNADLYAALTDQAEREQIPVEELHAYLLTAGLARRQKYEELWQRWETLSERERDVIAFACLRYTNQQTAAKIKISSSSVNWYLRKIQEKFNFHSKFEIQMQFKGWDFSNWGPKAQD